MCTATTRNRGTFQARPHNRDYELEHADEAEVIDGIRALRKRRQCTHDLVQDGVVDGSNALLHARDRAHEAMVLRVMHCLQTVAQHCQDSVKADDARIVGDSAVRRPRTVRDGLDVDAGITPSPNDERAKTLWYARL